MTEADDTDADPDDLSLERIATAILDGSPVDWSGAPKDGDGALLGQLHVLADLAALHRSLTHEPEDAAAIPDAELQPVDGVAWGSLTLRERIGRGAFGEVMRAWDTRLHRDVALKLLYRDAGRGRDPDASLREGRLLARVRHPNVLAVYGADRIEGRVGIWTEFIKGRTLAQIASDRRPFQESDVTKIGADLCQALTAVHDAGLLHRDVKLQNVMREDSGRIVLMDFGTGQLALEPEGIAGIAGTPLYVAPEILEGATADAQSDIYSAGVVLYRLLTGVFPVEPTGLDGLRAAHAAGRPAGVSERLPHVTPALAAAIDRAISPDRTRRFESAAAFGCALSKALTPVRPKRPLAWVAATAAVAAIAVLGWWYRAPPPASVAPTRWLLISAFENRTGDLPLGEALQFAFEQELMQSRALAIVPPERTGDVLQLMKRPAAARVDAGSAREVSLRDGAIQMFAVGRVDRVGQLLTMSVTVNDVATGARVFNAGIESPDIDGIVAQIKSLASTIRAGLGEHRGQVDRDAALARVTTASFKALQSYTTGLELGNAGRWAAAELALRDAVREDPGFASALILLGHALRNQQRPPAEYLEHAEAAMRLSQGLPSRERYFVAGSYHQMVGDETRAIAAYEILVKEHPDDFWGTTNLINIYARVGRYREALPLLSRRLTLRPNAYSVWPTTAQLFVIFDGDIDTARSILAKIKLLPPPDTRSLIVGSWTELFPVFDLWSRGQIREAAVRLDAMAGEARRDDFIAAAIGSMNVSLGRLRAAEEAFRTMSDGSDRQALLAYAALARDDISGARALLVEDRNLFDSSRPAPSQGSYGKATLILWTMIRAGLIDEADAFGRRGPFNDDPTKFVTGAIASARGAADAATAILEPIRKTAAPGNPQTILAIEALAEGLIKRGEFQKAEEILMQAPRRTTMYPSAGSRGYHWLRLRALLVNVSRQLGHTERAAEVERELIGLLAVADADFGLWKSIR